ncbi:MAG: ATPase, T2SS/T4P/T4SS family [Selenomonadaceae bacterium]|nr:ATPase, T2SS/T4P/T4SS family [Selenomonadaceae bacterium]
MQESFIELIRSSAKLGASDIHIVNGKIYRRIQGKLTALPQSAGISSSGGQEMITDLLDVDEVKTLQSQGAVDFALTIDDTRLRVNVYKEDNGLAAAIRILPNQFPSTAELHLERIARRLSKSIEEKTGGLVLVTGTTGSGKSTTLASLMDCLLGQQPRHAVTLEDPIEYTFRPGNEDSLISRRELGRDFFDFSEGIRQSLREMPDTLLVGEIRDEGTMTAALRAAESGILVMASLHTGTAPGAVERVAGFYSPERQPIILQQLSQVLSVVIAQRLVPADDSRRAIHEILTATPAVRNIIRTGSTAQLASAIVAGGNDDMITFEKSAGQSLRKV